MSQTDRRTCGPDRHSKVELKTFWRYLDLDRTLFVKPSFKQSQDQVRLQAEWPRDIQLLFCDEMPRKTIVRRNWLTLQRRMIFWCLERETTIVIGYKYSVVLLQKRGQRYKGNWEKCNDHFYLYFLWNFVMYCNFGWKIIDKLCVWAKPIMRYEMHPCPFPPILDPTNGLCW